MTKTKMGKEKEISIGTLRLWREGEDKPFKEVLPSGPAARLKKYAIHEASWNKDGTLLGLVDSENCLVIYKPDGTLIESFQDKVAKAQYQSFAWSPGSRYVAIGATTAKEHVVHVWDLKTKRRSKGHGAQVKSVRFWHQDNTRVASGATDGIILVHNLATGRSSPGMRPTGAEGDGINMIDFSPVHYGQLASGCESGAVRIWDTNSTAAAPTSLEAHSAPCSAIHYSPVNGDLLATVGLDRKVIFHDTREKKSVSSFNTLNPLTAACFHPNGHTILVGDIAGKVTTYDIRQNGAPIHEVEHTANIPIYSVCYERGPSSSGTSSALTLKPTTVPGMTTMTASSVSMSSLAKRAIFNKQEFIISSPARPSNSEPTASMAPTPSTELFSPARPIDSWSSSNDNVSVLSPISGSPVSGAPSIAPQDLLPADLLPQPQFDSLVAEPAMSRFRSSLDTSTTSIFSPTQSPTSLGQASVSSSSRDTQDFVPHTNSAPPGMESSDLFSPIKPSGGRSYSGYSSPSLNTSPGSIRPTASVPVVMTPTPRSVKSRSALFTESPGRGTPPRPDFPTSPTQSSSPALFGGNTTRRPPPMMASPLRKPSRVSLGQGRNSAMLPDDSFISSNLDDTRDDFVSQSFASDGTSGDALGRGSGGGSGGGAQFQMQVMQSSLQQMFNDFRDEVFEQVQNLHIDMIRQFHTQQLEITTLLKTLTAQNQATMDENRALREEIEQLRKMY